jgi:uncharacterized protein YndB with AHSA1/START domain
MIRRQVVIPASPRVLWEALTDPGLLRSWFGGEFEWDLTEGSPLRFHSDDGETREGRIESVREGKHLRFSWWPDGEQGNASEVSYLLEDGREEGLVTLTVQERPLDTPAGVSSPAQARARASDGGATWTAWDTRLAGAWAGIAGDPTAPGVSGGTSVRASV